MIKKLFVQNIFLIENLELEFTSGLNVLTGETVTEESFVGFYDSVITILNDNVNFNKEDLKLIDDKAKKIISEFSKKINEIKEFTREDLEPIIQELIKTNNTNFKGVGQPLRIALTGSKFGPGIYDIIVSLGKDEVKKRLTNKTIA